MAKLTERRTSGCFPLPVRLMTQMRDGITVLIYDDAICHFCLRLILTRAVLCCCTLTVPYLNVLVYETKAVNKMLFLLLLFVFARVFFVSRKWTFSF